MRNHEPRFHSGPLRKKCRKTLALIWISKAIRAAFAHAHQIGDRDRGVIERERERRPVKIPARNHITRFRQTRADYPSLMPTQSVKCLRNVPARRAPPRAPGACNAGCMHPAPAGRR